jgi:hypothetical protein
MDESLRSQIDSNLSHLDALIRRGRQLRDRLAKDPSDQSALVANRAWQQDCGLAIHNLSGGSKAHWLSRSFSEAFLMRAGAGQVVETVAPAEIAERLVSVLDQAAMSLSRMAVESVGSTAPSPQAAPPPRKFDFVHNTELRPVLEQAYAETRDAMDASDYGAALTGAAGILEAIVTDGLDTQGLDALASATQVPAGKIADWSFDERLVVAEKAGLIRGGCARLPESARRYRDQADADGNRHAVASESEAKRTLQVLHVVMRDLDPGR